MEQTVLSINDDKMTTRGELIEYPAELIGGRNLILNSLNRIVFLSNNPALFPIQDELVSGENYRRFRRTYPEGVTDNRVGTYATEHFTPEKSGYYTYSTYFRPNDFNIALRMRLGNTYGNFILCKASEWTQVSVTAWLEAAGVRILLSGVHGAMPPEAIQWIDYNRVSVTSGNKATDWTPAPEDFGLSYPDWVTEFKPSISENGILAPEFDESGVLSFSINRTTAQEFIENPNL